MNLRHGIEWAPPRDLAHASDVRILPMLEKADVECPTT
jgi:hypothetical protein